MIKKAISLFLIVGTGTLCAKPVTPASAKKIAESFYQQNAKTEITATSLAYTGLTTLGKPAYYAFNINSNNGFVIVSADDAAKPIIGYSTENQFVIPDAITTIGHWLKIRSKEIEAIQTKALLPTADVAIEWQKYSSNNSNLRHSSNNTTSSSTTSVLPLVQTTWNQSPYYNALCPGSTGNGTNSAACVTGCVATAMAQIMRYWNFPAHGTGSSSYNAGTYGMLSCNYGATTYNWANMPLSLSSSNNDVAVLNYQCGVSVDMEYSPSGSGAWVITSDDQICAQTSYVTYFGYDPTTIQGLSRSDYDDTTWINMLKSDLNIGRPIQYVGDDPAEGGHTWVCDGYDQNSNFHMNWGWGGQDNGYFDINNLATPGFNPSYGHQAVFGIVPIATQVVDAGIPSITAPNGNYCTTIFNPNIKLQNFGSNVLTSCVINYQIDNGALQTQNWNGSLVSGQATTVSLPNFTSAIGSHTLVCYSSNPNGAADGNMANNQSTIYFNVTLAGVLPVIEGFENSNLVSSNWATNHTSATGTDFAVTSNAAATGANCMMLDNMSNTAGNTSILRTMNSFDLTMLSNPALSFKVAYQQKATTNNDKLQVSVSTDCGNSWTPRLTRAGISLASVSTTGSTPFTPTVNQFTTYTVNINNVATSNSVIFRWEFMADPNSVGNNLYIDDINIVSGVSPLASGIDNIESAVGLNIYPNPSSGKYTVAFNFTEKHNVVIKVVDMLGRVVEATDAKSYQTGENLIELGTTNTYQTGVYFARINIDGQQISKKIIIE